MNNRNTRDAERRKYIREKTEENLKAVLNDPESLFNSDKEIPEIK
jgi:hypothetical protein